MRVEPMHDKNNTFQLIGYRLVAENRDEERILNLNRWTAYREQFSELPNQTAIQVWARPLLHPAGPAKDPSET